MFLGLDTSNYTTSAAVWDGAAALNSGRLLDVRPGELGLRQSDALFQHVKNLPEVFARLFETFPRTAVRAVAASTRPRAVEGSYMPCFLAGANFGRCMAETLGVPFYAVSHQQGHIAASLWSAGRLDLMDRPHLAWHLSGGTTELLYVEPDGRNVCARRIGGTTDISAGQAIDRAGVKMGLAFPCGKAMDALSHECASNDFFRVKLNGLEFSLSGLENKTADCLAAGKSEAETAGYTLRSVCDVIYRATKAAKKEYPGLEVVFSGGVSSNSMLRELCAPFAPVFALPQYATDNAMGVAVLCARTEGP